MSRVLNNGLFSAAGHCDLTILRLEGTGLANADFGGNYNLITYLLCVLVNRDWLFQLEHVNPSRSGMRKVMCKDLWTETVSLRIVARASF